MVIKTASPGVIVNEIDLTRGTSDAITTNAVSYTHLTLPTILLV